MLIFKISIFALWLNQLRLQHCRHRFDHNSTVAELNSHYDWWFSIQRDFETSFAITTQMSENEMFQFHHYEMGYFRFESGLSLKNGDLFHWPRIQSSNAALSHGWAFHSDSINRTPKMTNTKTRHEPYALCVLWPDRIETISDLRTISELSNSRALTLS